MRKLNQKGSIMVFFTLAFALLMVFLGFAIDFGRAYLAKTHISRLVDAAALAAAKAFKGQPGLESVGTSAACDSMVMNGAPVMMSGNTCVSTADPSFTASVDFPLDPAQGIFNARIVGTELVPTTFLRMLGFMSGGDFSTISVAAAAQAGPERPLDLMLVLDRSGSMGDPYSPGKTKIVALKTAVNEFLALANTFTVNDRIGMVSFATRGCGTNGQDSTANNCSPDVPLDFATDSLISTLQGKINGLAPDGATNTMEAVQTARGPLAQAFDDPTRATTRKAVLLVTDGQPTFMTLKNTLDCQNDPKTGAPIDTNGPNGCKMGVGLDYDGGYRNSLDVKTIPTKLGSGSQLYQDIIRCTRALVGCITNGAMYEANRLRNCGFNNSACDPSGAHDVVFFAIAIGKKDLSDPQGSLDENAKCMLARMANATDILNAATGVVETMADMCNGKFTSTDKDAHNDLVEAWPNCAGPCIDTTQRKGKVYTVDVDGDVEAQLRLIFREIAALLKLRLVS